MFNFANIISYTLSLQKENKTQQYLMMFCTLKSLLELFNKIILHREQENAKRLHLPTFYHQTKNPSFHVQPSTYEKIQVKSFFPHPTLY